MAGLNNQLEPLPYQVELREYLKSHERDLWNWFASARAQADYTENLRLDLLKSTYRLDADSHPEIYKSVEQAKSRLQLDIPVTVYQAQNSPQPNAALYFIPGEGHIVFSGSVLSLLDAEELKSVIGHELAHYHLWQWESGELHIADRLLEVVANDPRASASHEQSARRFQLYTEIFADRGSLCVTEDVHPVVSGLVKIQTGLSQISAPGYLKQAEEFFAKKTTVTEGVSHPEAFIRARALALWHDQNAEAASQISRMIEGVTTLDDLDLLGQARLATNTRRMLEQFLQPKWFQTPAVLGHAKLFFDNFQPAKTKDAAVFDQLEISEPKIGEFLCYVLLDFVTADRDLDEVPLAAALDLAERVGISAPFEKLATKELKMKARDIRKIKEQAAEMLAKSEVSGD
jgi:predicted SprT family Zn-dependent metalloprotease